MKHMYKNMKTHVFLEKMDFVTVFPLLIFDYLVGEKPGRKIHDEKSMDVANVFHMFFLMVAL